MEKLSVRRIKMSSKTKMNEIDYIIGDIYAEFEARSKYEARRESFVNNTLLVMGTAILMLIVAVVVIGVVIIL